MSADPRHFTRSWVITCVLIAALVAAAAAAVDPYLLFNMPRIKGFNDKKPSVESQERLMKAYEVVRAAPNALILGTSRVAIGLDTAHASWPARARPVYNLGVAGADPYTSYRYLQHVLAHRELTIVVLGLDFEYFLVGKKRDPSTPLAFESYLSVDRDGRPDPSRRWYHLRDLGEATLSLEALGDSIATVAASVRGETLDVSPSGNLSEAGFRRETAELGSAPLFAQRNLYNIRTYRGRTFSQNSAGQADAPALADLRAIVELCRTRGIQLELFAQPMHADLLETLDLLGAWPAYESWKRELVEIGRGEARGRGPAVRVWDFGGYDQFSTETLPASSDRRGHLRWFWEPSHYSKALGNIILTRIFGGPDTGYGVVLTAETIDARLADVRERRKAYRESHPEAVRRIRAIYDSASR
jgi:hypothetical protein